MGIKIDWSELSSKQLIDIYNYYSLKASPRIAKKIINRIIDRVEVLRKNPLSGSKEKLLEGMP
ncbi:MAG: type II toxin-antitoxin system RelE/ParE family toxin [Dysgonamonadaceae bacterium]|jgi:plasmid stabilization system protein ParE|nr:type II toxin-antitoxin system RelE/ParE family toxin [Dysgonamonadaceae bacterium]MDD3356130.1 type II toxin-antitoxin system RelE/ParE family toxin [Dysgonamonadaceae bacterium]MDD3728218.1 type II toxin-antitoxin system RelE/ParE family toxin [Dysgonamonadaceae bacterium]MDD4245785.1 type II toxin-antitoxin system RelE/ParE family toxin [Dysgonamonadaceae bacterium]